jgi:DNA-binding transcriptional ArsR family regulator
LNEFVQGTALQAIASPRRRQILRLVWDSELSSADIAAHFDVTWPAISQNLGVLKGAGLVQERRAGARRLYLAERANLGPLQQVLKEMWESDLDRLAGLAESEQRRR